MVDMVNDILLQAVLILVVVFMFLLMYNVPQKALSKISFGSRTNLQAKRHFVQGAQLLEKARSAKDGVAASSLAKSAAEEADKAVGLNPKDAAAHILKALALELQGYKTSALDALDVALSPMAVKSLSDEERGDALFKRAELKVAMSRTERVDSAIADLVDSVKFRTDNPRAFFVSGQCYETKGMTVEAKKAYEDALRVQPMFTVAQEALDRLGS
ncbi:uncharacterized protein LOC132272694 [Cornus florida]|uniref:uncharacterized protein LOC132272694 n=1 Tax=Cornus florida TaxID=4283 RepID=UPI002899089E|nr:uncharacterized protein LOC132272694 [Cornus florida]